MELVPALTIGLPLLAAAVGRLPGLSRRPRLADVVTIGTSLGVAVLAMWALPTVLDDPFVHWVGGWQPVDGVAVGIPLVADGIAMGIVALAGVLTAAASAYMVAVYDRLGNLAHVLMMLLLGAVNGFVLSGDLFSMFVFVELLGITTYTLTAYKVGEEDAAPAAFNLATLSTLGAVLFLAGVAIAYGILATPNLAEAGVRAADPVVGGSALVVAAALMIAGLSPKTGLAPFHPAIADAHTAAMAPHAGLFGALTLPVGLYGVARLHSTVTVQLADAGERLSGLLLVLALTTAVVGGVMALVQRHVKRILAFSSVSHVGIAAVGVALGSGEGLTGSALYVIGHGLLKVGLLLSAGLLLHTLASVDVARLAGRGRQARPAVVLLGVGAPLLAGAPPSGLYAGKSQLEAAATASGRWWVMVLVYVAAVLTGAAVFRAVVHLWWGWPAAPDPHGEVPEGGRETAETPGRTPRAMVAVPAVLIVLAASLVLAPGLVDATAAAADRFVRADLYVGLVLDGTSATLDRRAVTGLFGAESLGKGLLAGGAAIALGIAAARDLPDVQARPMGAPLRWVRRAHSGDLGDYTTFASAGVAIWCVWALVSALR